MNYPALPVLYRDDTIAVVNKLPQMLVHRTEISNGDSVFALQCAREQFGRHVWVVHRLDRATSGVLVFAFSAEMASALGRAMMAGEVTKRYAAIVRGWGPQQLLIDHALTPPKDPYLRVQKLEPQEAITLAHCLARSEVPVVTQSAFPTTRVSLMELRLVTGRRHQLRRHMKHIAHPIIGDSTYGKGPVNRALASYWSVERLLLHCATMSFIHPITAQMMTIRAEPDEGFARVLQTMGWTEDYNKAFSLLP